MSQQMKWYRFAQCFVLASIFSLGCSPSLVRKFSNAENSQDQEQDQNDDSQGQDGVVFPPSSASAIAHWDMVPFQDFTGNFNVGVLAYHHLGIRKVRFWVSQSNTFSADPQFEVNRAEPNPATLDSRTWGELPTLTRPAVEEYFITLNAAQYVSGVPIRVKAVAVPNSGLAKTVLFPSSNGQDFVTFTPWSPSPQRKIYYASQGAQFDANSQCTQAAPCSSIAKVFQKIQADGGAAQVQGAEIRLGASTLAPWNLEGAGAPSFQNQNRWLVIRSAPGVSPLDVEMNPFPSGYVPTWSVELTKFEDLTLLGPMYSSYQNANNKRVLWLNRVAIVGNGYSTIQQGDSWSISGGSDASMWTASFMTDSFMNQVASGPRNQELARNVYAKETGDGHSSGSATVVNYTVKTIFGSMYDFAELGVGPDYHGDIYQCWSRRQDIILFGLGIEPGGFISSRGIVGSSVDNYKDIAIVNTQLDMPGQWVFSFCASTTGHVLDHFIVKDSRLVGSGHICGESGSAVVEPANMRNMLYSNSVFENGSPSQLPQPAGVAGVRIEE